MGKLRFSPPRLRTLRKRLESGYSGKNRLERERERDERRRSEQPWRAWYKLELWDHPRKGLRAQQLERQPICETCRAARATIAHHKRPHQGIWELFIDHKNLESACKACHDGAIQRGERAGNYSTEIDLSADAAIAANVLYPQKLQRSAIPLTIVCGAPGSGKSTYVEKHKQAGEITIDIDAIVAELAGTKVRSNQVQRDYLQAAMIERNRRLHALAHERCAPAAWFIIGAPQARERERWAASLGAAHVVVIETPLEECLARIYRDADRAPLADEISQAATGWWTRYSRSALDHATTTGDDVPCPAK
jgi:5-methylcytosine-specific restriction protein A